MKKLIYTNQGDLFGGKKEIVGYGSDEYHIREIDRTLANKTIIRNHYSKKVFNGTFIHLGVYMAGEFVGVLQFGYAMNPSSAKNVVTGTPNDGYVELNRMWLDDKAPKNSESMAISYAITYIKNKFKKVKWIQSFADERCGKNGIVYQAANFEYYGEHTSTFWVLGDEVFHNIHMTVKTKVRGAAAKLQLNKDDAEPMTLRQFRYLYWIDRREKKNVCFPQIPFVKHYLEAEQKADEKLQQWL